MINHRDVQAAAERWVTLIVEFLDPDTGGCGDISAELTRLGMPTAEAYGLMHALNKLARHGVIAPGGDA